MTAFNVLVAATLLTIVSCGRINEPEVVWRLQPGLIGVGGGHEPPISLPDTIPGTGWRSLVVQTWGSSACTRAAGADIEYGQQRVDISPIDSIAIGGTCTDDLPPHPRNVGINFNSDGTWTVRVIGRSFDDGAVFETQVVVTNAVTPD